MLLPLLLACTDPVAPTPEPIAAAACGDWASVGQPFALGWCTSCHSSRLPAGHRYGAPEGVDLDTLAGMRKWSERVSVRALGDDADMPPGSHASASERAALAAWIACGAPGEEASMPEGERDADLLGAVTLTGGVTEADGGVLLSQNLDGEGWLRQSFVGWPESGLAAALVGPDGGVAESVSFEPPLAVWDDAERTLQSAVVATREGAAGVVVAEEDWTVTREVDAQPDPRFMEAAPERVVAEVDGEAAFVWWFSPTRMLVAQAMRLEDGTWRSVLNTAPVAQRPSGDGFPLEAGGSWAARGTLLAVAP